MVQMRRNEMHIVELLNFELINVIFKPKTAFRSNDKGYDIFRPI